jgi:ribosomal protein L32
MACPRYSDSAFPFADPLVLSVLRPLCTHAHTSSSIGRTVGDVFLPSPGAISGAGDAGGLITCAVPKKKVSISRSRKRRHAPGKERRNITHIEDCRACGQPKLRQHVCLNCSGWKVS